MTNLKDAKTITSSLNRSKIILYKTLHGSEEAVNQLNIDGEYITETLNEHKYNLKSSLISTKTRLLTVKSYELWEKYSLIGLFILFSLHFSNLFLFLLNFRFFNLFFSCCILYSCKKIKNFFNYINYI